MARHANTTPNRIITSPRNRAYVYRVFLAAGPLLLFYGVMSAQEFALWGGAAGTILSVPTGLALANTPKPSTELHGTPG